jgi:hypothetical protein
MDFWYRLEGRTVSPDPSRRFQPIEERRIARTEVTPEVSVSTVFLGIDHSFNRDGPPLLFETMVFGGHLDQQMDRYATLEEAEAGHVRWVDRVRRGWSPDHEP